jgi:hypothetical protein
MLNLHFEMKKDITAKRKRDVEVKYNVLKIMLSLQIRFLLLKIFNCDFFQNITDI